MNLLRWLAARARATSCAAQSSLRYVCEPLERRTLLDGIPNDPVIVLVEPPSNRRARLLGWLKRWSALEICLAN